FEQSPTGSVEFEDGTGFAEDITPVTSDAAPEAKQTSSARQNSSPTELPATGGRAFLPVASITFMGGAGLLSLGVLLLVARRRRAS
ncbi:MAG: hypothetical protein M3N18_09125, partial [Actinomycetota bacterium]|nr:hypothetical protein [Actinomycetota bacterium]